MGQGLVNRIFPSTAPPPGMEPRGVTALPEAAVTHACPDCGTPAASPEQEWCLECGSRIEEKTRSWHQPVAVMASVALIFVAAVALALSEVAKDAEIAKAKTVRKYVAAPPPPTGPAVPPAPEVPAPSPDDQPPDTSSNPTDDPLPADPGAGAGTDPGAGSTDPGTADAGTTDPGSVAGPTDVSGLPGGGGGGGTTPEPEPVATWPEGKSAWTVILLSTTDKAEAEELARKARDAGIQAGILESSKYRKLAEGLWMVWADRFSSEEAAYAGADRFAAKGFTGESVENIVPKD